MGEKRKRSTTMDDHMDATVQSPFLTMFEAFRAELDQHHDRRERVIKASRDITASSKKIIFALQRVRKLNSTLQPGISKSIQPHLAVIRERFAAIAPDLQSINSYRYQRQITSGIQEFMEAEIFRHYLEKQQIMSFEDARESLTAVPVHESEQEEISDSKSQIDLTEEDYLLGIFDATGELMRFAITNMATSGALLSEPQEGASEGSSRESIEGPRTVVQDMQFLRSHLSALAIKSNFEGYMTKEVKGKLQVMLESVEKVEKALYGLLVRGSERPQGWMPDLNASSREPIEVVD